MANLEYENRDQKKTFLLFEKISSKNDLAAARTCFDTMQTWWRYTNMVLKLMITANSATIKAGNRSCMLLIV